MESSSAPTIKRLMLRLYWICLFILVMGAVSYYFESQKAEQAVHKYIRIWEDDIVTSKILNKDTTILLKILTQLQSVHPAVAEVSLQEDVVAQCVRKTEVSLSYNGLPSGQIQVCLHPAKIAGFAAISPMFLLGVALSVFFVFLYMRKEHLEALRLQSLQAQARLNEKLAKVSRQVAHDIRGPLTALMTLSKLPHDRDSESQHLLNLSVQRIQGIAEELLSKGQAMALETVPEVFDGASQISLTDELQDLLKEYRFSNPRIQFELHNHVKRAGAERVSFERIKFQRIVSNILNNAIDAMPEGDPSISLTLMEKEKGIILQILDNGCGIPEELLSEVVKEGYSYGKEGGHGLGLFDASEFLKSIGGELQVTSRLGMGTQILLVFPRDFKATPKSLEVAPSDLRKNAF